MRVAGLSSIVRTVRVNLQFYGRGGSCTERHVCVFEPAPLRGATQGKGKFSMEYRVLSPSLPY